MSPSRRQHLEAAAWRVGDASQFLSLTPVEAALVEVRLSLSDALKRRRLRRRLTQEALAARLGSSQSRIARLESGARSASIDLLVRALLATGATVAQIASSIGTRRRAGV